MTARTLLWRVLAFLLGARYELIRAQDGSKYLSRWHFPAWLARRMGARGLFLHRFHASDPDRGWHNHPWSWCESKLLAGAYAQETLWIKVEPAVAVRRGIRLRVVSAALPPAYYIRRQVFEAGDRNRLTSQFHAVRLLTPTVWTLFKTGPKHGKSWGFKDIHGQFTPANPVRGEMH